MRGNVYVHKPYLGTNTASLKDSNDPAPDFVNWKLALDGAVHRGSYSTGSHSRSRARTPSQGHSARAERMPQRAAPPPLPQPRFTARKSQVTPQPQLRTGPLSLAPWEAKAVQVYRGLRRCRRQYGTTAPSFSTSDVRVASPGNAWREQPQEEVQEAASESVVAPSLVPMIASALDTCAQWEPCRVREVCCPDHPTGSCYVPPALMLQYFLRIGYPLQVSRVDPAFRAQTMADRGAQTYTALLISAAQQTVRWFHGGGTMDDTPDASPPSLDFLPSVLGQMVMSHHMSVRTAAIWVVRVCVGFMTAESNRLAEERHLRDGKSRSTVPDWPLSQTCMENIRLLAQVMRDAVYRLQGNALPTVRLDERVPTRHGLRLHVGEEEDEEDGSSGNSDDGGAPEVSEYAAGGMPPSTTREGEDDEWKYFHLLVLQQAVSLLVRGCLIDPPPASSERTGGRSDDRDGGEAMRSDIPALPPPAAPDAALLPLPSSSCAVLQGLRQLIFFIRAQYNLYAPDRLYCRTDLDGRSAFFAPVYPNGPTPPWPELNSEKRVLHRIEKQWVAFAEATVPRVSNILTTNNYRYIPAIAGALSIR
ncbi:hypothetical protein ABB37_04788 [Leptomonas pyrrhocoris]|uniref:Uncharacterized protein n=1 Tax=Leptomonas pyrrhocoris TaxID=157538 RepID=A0A0M9G1P3_LEPPY|nr:hypothetical protein ABB37_04788 [Leptomonas pyrrhocoris]KPA80590.1 hypothetical protein ABB37_04788 [Leptomonas pyrrhocoris]|eukprot:XP_015659029.1 hypothetical protein ABB37_04788 [Leptomonas pyrrhocoris]